MPEAKLVETENGMVAQGDGWFVLNARDAVWGHSNGLGSYVPFDYDGPFPELGFNINVLRAGEYGSMYHAEGVQEGFLVLAGEGIVVVEGQERALRPWDYFHCPADTPHVLVATSAEPFVYIAAGVRRKGSSLVYAVDEVARRHGASVPEETSDPKVAYEGVTVERGRYREGDLPGYESRSTR